MKMTMKNKTAYNNVPVTWELGEGGMVKRWHTRYEGTVFQFWMALYVPEPHTEDNWVEFDLGESTLRDFYGTCHPSGSVFIGSTSDDTTSVAFSFGPGTTDLRIGWNIFAGTGF